MTVPPTNATRGASLPSVNGAPTASDDTGATDEDTVLNLAAAGVLANDSDPDASDTLSVTAFDAVSALGAAVTVNPDGSYSYNPTGSAALGALAAGESTTDSFTYNVSDGNGGSDTATVTITVSGRNDAPTAGDDTGATDEDTVLNLAAAGVLANDSDPDASDTLSVTAFDAVSALGAAVTVNPDGSYSYDPTGSAALGALAAGESTTDSFTYTASDGNGGSDTATVTITVSGANDTPTASDDTGATDEDTVLNLAAAGVLANDSDPDTSDSLTVTAFDAVSTLGAAVTVNPDGSYSYNPTGSAALGALAAGESTTDSFTYTVSDGNGGSDTATVTITVSGVNDAPTASDDSVLTNIVDGSVITIPIAALIANDSDPDGDQLTGFTVVGGSATGGSAVVNGSNVVFTPEPGAFAAGSFSYTISDGVLTSAPALATIAATSGAIITGGADSDILIGNDVSLTLSVIGNATLGGLTFDDDDLVDYDPGTDTAALVFDGDTLFSTTSEDIDAVHVLANGHIVLSTIGNATLGGLTFGDDDLVDYDPVSDTATLFFDGGALFSNTSEDINAVHVLANGHIILSTVGDATLGGLTFGDDDLVDYDPVSDTATLFFDGGALFSTTNEDINAVHVLANGHIILSTVGNATLGGLTFGDDDLVEYDPVTDTTTLFFDGGALFSNTSEDIDAIYVAGNDVLTGGLGDDWLDGSAGSDSLYGGAGDDILVWDAADMAIDGGSGTDTLRVESGAVDLTAFTGTITGIEEIDLEADTAANSVTLTAQDVLDISDSDSVAVFGDTNDSIDAGIGWTDGGFDSVGNHIFTQMVGPSLATLIVDPDVSVNPDILM